MVNRFSSFLMMIVITMITACGGGGGSDPSGSFHSTQVSIGQDTMIVTLWPAGEQNVIGFLPANKAVRLLDIASVCVDSDNLG